MSKKHTPGPWYVSRDATPEAFPQYTIHADTTMDRVATVFGEANARLIAAAPDLLACLQLALDVLATKVSIKAVDGEHVFHVAQDMQRAIAKATGGDA